MKPSDETGGKRSAWQNFEERRAAGLKGSPESAGEDLRPEDAEAYPVGSPKWLALTDADVDARDRERGK